MLLMAAGCATNSVIGNATGMKSLCPDRVDKFDHAFAGPDGRLVVCITGALPESSETQNYTFDIPLSKYLTDTGAVLTSGQINLPRTVVEKGWPTERDVAKRNLRPVPVELYERKQQFTSVKAEFSALRPPEAGEDIIYVCAPKSYLLFAYIRRSPLVGDNNFLTFSLCEGGQKPAYVAWVLLPFAIVIDVATAPIQVPLLIAVGQWAKTVKN